MQLSDLRTGRSIGGPVRGDSGQQPEMAFSPDGARLATGGADGTVRLWDSRTGQLLLGPLKGNEYSVVDLLFSPDGKQLAVVNGGSRAIAWMWDVHSGRLISGPLNSPEGMVSAVAFGPDGALLAAIGGINQPVLVWNPRNGAAVAGPLAVSTVTTGAFSPDGRTLALNEDGVVRLWDLWPFRNPLTHLCQRVGSISAETWRDMVPGEPVPDPCR
ncbi:WD40 repeat domain-containing protein [Paractinoplanes rishiriensis]|uniref:WD40 repeat domain-containing protein n=1 Tax=Paractinoplanes rishiriensis TaxID=1050105 RepID=UPI0019456ED9|nr:WD40 repeat domain-containing protein [Actinoplanes rishiriensis]